MLPHNIESWNGKRFALALEMNASSTEQGAPGGLVQSSRGCTVIEEAGAVRLALGNDGLWIPYVLGKVAYGHLTNAHAWLASGPFSGCELAIGTNTAGTFVAHIARETSATDTSAYAGLGETHRLYRAQIQLAVNHNYACYVFASVQNAVIQQMVRVDVHADSCGGSNGTVVNVVEIDPLNPQPAMLNPPTMIQDQTTRSWKCCVAM
ncbi:MAG: hypothetical protein RL701_4453 [Pseudomonadota bacterium]|jgi:hypothetical protein